MKTRIFLVAMALVVFASLSFGQGFCRMMWNYESGIPLAEDCVGGPGLPDGTPVYIYWDANSNGPDEADGLASTIPPPCLVNYSSFPLNGDGLGVGAGYFITDIDFCSAGCMPSPARFYLRVNCPDGTPHWLSDVHTFQSGPGDELWNVWNCIPCYTPPQCTPTVEAVIQAPCGPNNPACRTSVCLDLCAGFQTIVRVCGPAGLPMDPAHAPVSSWLPGCDPIATECDHPCDPAGGYDVTGPFVGADGCWFYVIIGGPQEGCLCFTFQYFLAANFNNDFVPLAMDNSVKLTWSTASETNMLRYDIVRGSEVVGRVDATNASGRSEYSFVDNSAVNGTTYSYTLRSVGMDNVSTDLATVEGVTPSFNAAVITEYALHQNFPNPFNPTTEIAFDVLNSNPVTLKIYNAAGQEVATLLNGVSKEHGRYVVNFDSGNLTTGLYFYTVKIGSEFSATKKMLLVK